MGKVQDKTYIRLTNEKKKTTQFSVYLILPEKVYYVKNLLRCHAEKKNKKTTMLGKEGTL